VQCLVAWIVIHYFKGGYSKVTNPNSKPHSDIALTLLSTNPKPDPTNHNATNSTLDPTLLPLE